MMDTAQGSGVHYNIFELNISEGLKSGTCELIVIDKKT